MKHSQASIQCTLALLALGVCAGLLTGCQTPDLKPFRDSTATIHNSVVQAQYVYTAELERLRSFAPDDPALALQSQRFATNWQVRVAVMDAMVRYAGSLAAVADAPNKSKAGLEKVAQSVKEMGVAAGPYQSTVEAATGIGLELVDLANRVRAARQLRKAVLLTDPAMQKVAVVLTRDFSQMRFALEQNQKSIKNLMDGSCSRQLNVREAVENRIKERTEALQQKLGDTACTNAVAQFNQETAEETRYLAEADRWYLPHQARVEAAQKELGDEVTFLRETETALAEWAKAHAALVQALETGLAPDWTLLRQSADRIAKNINKITHQPNQP